MSTTKRINQKKVDQIGYQRGRWAIYLFLAIVVVCQLLPFYLAINASMKPQTDMSSTLMPRLHDIAWDNWTAAISGQQRHRYCMHHTDCLRGRCRCGLSARPSSHALQ